MSAEVLHCLIELSALLNCCRMWKPFLERFLWTSTISLTLGNKVQLNCSVCSDLLFENAGSKTWFRFCCCCCCCCWKYKELWQTRVKNKFLKRGAGGRVCVCGGGGVRGVLQWALLGGRYGSRSLPQLRLPSFVAAKYAFAAVNLCLESHVCCCKPVSGN